MTYQELQDKVCQLSNYLRSVGVTKGSFVAIYMPMLMELPIAMLACARIGAVHSVRGTCQVGRTRIEIGYVSDTYRIRFRNRIRIRYGF